MVSVNLVAAVAVLPVAMALLWLYLRRYEGYFEQNRLFFALIIGLFAGTLVRALEFYLFGFEHPRLMQGGDEPLLMGALVYSFAYTAAGYATLETLGKTAVLGFKKFRMRKDTAYYGTALGAGFGAMWTMQVVAAPFVGLAAVPGTRELDTSAPLLVYDALLVVLGWGMLLAHAGSAVWVGRGASQGKLWQGALFGALWLAPVLMAYWGFINSVLPKGVAAVFSLAWGLFVMGFATRRVLEKIVPPEIRDMVRKERRRELRRKGREASQGEAAPSAPHVAEARAPSGHGPPEPGPARPSPDAPPPPGKSHP